MTLLLLVVVGFLLGGAISLRRQGHPRVALAMGALALGSVGAWPLFVWGLE